MPRAIPRAVPALALALLCGIAWGGKAEADPPGKRYKEITIGRICDLIERHAEQHGLPREFFARLIWKESRFDANAVSPKGAEGIAQFMPGTAKLRGLADAFDIEQAIPASARYLGELKARFGNLGLAAAAYNSGENRVSRWLASGGFLPLETENYVLDILGEPADKFAEPTYVGAIRPLDPKKGFREACRNLPVSGASMIAMATIHQKPWGVQVAGNFRRSAAVAQWQRVSQRHAGVLAGHEPVVSRVRSGRGRMGVYAVRIGASDRAEADGICADLRKSGGSCIVMRNR
jgi:hypothetical protein